MDLKQLLKDSARGVREGKYYLTVEFCKYFFIIYRQKQIYEQKGLFVVKFYIKKFLLFFYRTNSTRGVAYRYISYGEYKKHTLNVFHQKFIKRNNTA